MDLAGALGLGASELVGFAGAGGKKTAMARLVEQGDERDLSVGYTTTTHVPPPGSIPLVLAGADGLDAALADAPDPVAFAAERVGDPDRADVKVRGYDPATVAAVDRRGRFDWLLVKADGARRREFKAPGPAEPQLPPNATTAVTVASVRALGATLDETVVHRPQRVASLTDLALGDELTPAAMATVLASPDGGRRAVPTSAAWIPTVNKADTGADRAAAREVVERVLDRTDRADRGLVTSFEAGVLDVVEG
jgi:probable selenium-dependent hydroxylase accessory protein YqeC